MSKQLVAVTFLVQKYAADGDSMFLRNAGTLYQVTQRYILNGRNVQQIKQRPTPFISFSIHPKMWWLLNIRANDSVSKGKG